MDCNSAVFSITDYRKANPPYVTKLVPKEEPPGTIQLPYTLSIASGIHTQTSQPGISVLNNPVKKVWLSFYPEGFSVAAHPKPSRK